MPAAHRRPAHVPRQRSLPDLSRAISAELVPFLDGAHSAATTVRRIAPFAPTTAAGASFAARVAAAVSGAEAAAAAVAAAVDDFKRYVAEATAASAECSALVTAHGVAEDMFVRVATRVAAAGFAADVFASGRLNRATLCEEELWDRLAFLPRGRRRRTPLMAAAAKGSASRLAFLIARAREPPAHASPAAAALITATRAARIDARDAQGRTALSWAASRADGREFISLLLDAGADPAAVDKNSLPPLAHATSLAAAELLLPRTPHDDTTLARWMDIPRHFMPSVPAVAVAIVSAAASGAIGNGTVLHACESIARWRIGLKSSSTLVATVSWADDLIHALPSVVVNLLERHSGDAAVAEAAATALLSLCRGVVILWDRDSMTAVKVTPEAARQSARQSTAMQRELDSMNAVFVRATAAAVLTAALVRHAGSAGNAAMAATRAIAHALQGRLLADAASIDVAHVFEVSATALVSIIFPLDSSIPLESTLSPSAFAALIALLSLVKVALECSPQTCLGVFSGTLIVSKTLNLIVCSRNERLKAAAFELITTAVSSARADVPGAPLGLHATLRSAFFTRNFFSQLGDSLRLQRKTFRTEEREVNDAMGGCPDCDFLGPCSEHEDGYSDNDEERRLSDDAIDRLAQCATVARTIVALAAGAGAPAEVLQHQRYVFGDLLPCLTKTHDAVCELSHLDLSDFSQATAVSLTRSALNEAVNVAMR
jgi:hypothetical protein